MDEKKFAVLLTDTQDVKVVECDPQEEIFGIARGLIGCDWIELVEAEPLADKGYLMLIDEEGKLKGSVLVVDFDDRAGVDEYLSGEPYVVNNVWEKITVEPINVVIMNGKKVGK